MSISRLIDVILRKKDTDDDKIKTSRFVYIGESIFKGEIKNKQEKYDRSKNHIIFKSQFYGNTEFGYFAAEIIPPKHSSFPLNTFLVTGDFIAYRYNDHILFSSIHWALSCVSVTFYTLYRLRTYLKTPLS